MEPTQWPAHSKEERAQTSHTISQSSAPGKYIGTIAPDQSGLKVVLLDSP